MASLRLCLIIFLIKCVIGQDNSTVSSETDPGLAPDNSTEKWVNSESAPQDLTIEHVTVKEGESVVLKCLNTTTQATFCKFKYPHPSSPSNQAHCHISKPKQTKACDDKRPLDLELRLGQLCSMTITRATIGDQGNWECEVYSDGDHNTKTVFEVHVNHSQVLITLNDEPTNRLELTKVPMKLGHSDHQELKCGLGNYEDSELSFKWTKNGVDLNVDNSSLVLNEITLTKEDVGQSIQCNVTTKIDQQLHVGQSIELDLQFPPQAQPEDYEVHYTLRNNSPTLMIYFWANPKPTQAIWTIDSKKHSNLEPKETGRKGRWYSAAPAGLKSTQFQLKVKNELGKAKYTFEGLYSATELVKPPQKLGLLIDGRKAEDSFQLNWTEPHEIEAECQVLDSDVNSKVLYTWKMNGQVLEEMGSKSTISIDIDNPGKNGAIIRCEVAYQDQEFEGTGHTSIETQLVVNYDPQVVIQETNGNTIAYRSTYPRNIDSDATLNLKCLTEKYHGSPDCAWDVGRIQRSSDCDFNLTLKPSDHGKTVKCKVSNYFAEFTLDLTFKPVESKKTAVINIADNKPEATVTMTFQANPQPTNATWIIDDLHVPMDQTVQGYNSSALKKSGSGTKFEITLSFPMKDSMDGQAFKLNVTNDLGMTTYTWQMEV